MTSRFDTRRFAASIKTKRGKSSLRDCAREIGGISATTLSRAEREGAILDVPLILRICDWLERPIQEFIQSDLPPQLGERSSIELVEVALRMDGSLDSELTEAIIRLVKTIKNSNARVLLSKTS
jgi:transcriptional regulator with XRE-family HTH domain